MRGRDHPRPRRSSDRDGSNGRAQMPGADLRIGPVVGLTARSSEPAVSRLQRLDGLCARSLRPLALGELHALSFTKLLEASALHGRGMKKEILPAAGRDESKTLVGQTLNGTFCHGVLLLGR